MPGTDEPSTSCQVSRHDFEAACKAFIYEADVDPSPDSDSLGAHLVRKGWGWQEHPVVPGLGFLTRDPLFRHVRPIRSKPSHPLERSLQEADLGTVDEISDTEEATPVTGGKSVEEAAGASSSIRVTLSVLYSDTYRVPALFFTACHQDSGSPLTLDELIRSTIFVGRRSLLQYPFTTLSAHPTSLPDDADADAPLVLPFLTAAEHPVGGTACWAVHPCNTADLLRDIVGGEGGEQLQGLQYLEAWMAIVGSLVDLRDGL